MKNRRGFIQIPILIAIIASVLVLGGGGYLGAKQYKIKVEKEIQVQEQVDKQEKALEQAQIEIEKLKEQNEQTKSQQNSLKTAQQEIQKLKQESTNNQSLQKPDLPTIVDQWKSSTVKITCFWDDSTPGVTYSAAAGSGVIDGVYKIQSSSKTAFAVLTNRHVVTQDVVLRKGAETISIPVGANECNIQILGNPKQYVAKENNKGIYINNSQDQAVLFVENIDDNFKNAAIKKHCVANSARIGDSIVVLGYPGIGASQGITATEGIISGVEKPYYVTSAKIDHGNSGGVAVLTGNNCYLGIPTFVEAGELESLGRILDINAI